MLVKDTTISHYRILRLIGRGGMSEVYLARDERLQRRVALKLISSPSGPGDERTLRFQQEARAASALNHPNIVTVFDAGEDKGRSFIATEWIEGETLRERIDRGPIALLEVLEIAQSIAAALVAAHGAGIIHRDIKPENVMIRPDGLVKVLDFGLAKLLEPALSPAGSRAGERLTEPGLVMGTVSYMSPEQLRGADVDGRTDLFSLGEVVYEMITGCNPFDGPSTSETIAAILEREPKPLESRVGDLPDRLASIVEHALRKHPEDRYASAIEMFADIRELRYELELLEHRRRSGERQSEAVRKRESREVTAVRRTSGSSYVLQEVRANRDVLVGALVLFVLIAGAFIYFAREAEAYDSIAVLPFANASGSEDTEYLSDGLTESVIHSLSRIGRIQVMAPSSVFQYKGSREDPRVAGKQLKVEAVLTGTVQQRGDTLIVRADLVDVERGTILWGEEYHRRRSDLLLLQREISEEISSKLRLRLTGSEKARMSSHADTNPRAFEEYLRGRYWWNTRTDQGLRRAVDHFEASIAEDPSFPLSYAGLADAYNLMPVYGAAAPSDSFPRAKAAALRALALDDQIAEAHTSLAWVHMNYDWDWASAEDRFAAAIDINPSYATAHHWYSLFLSAMGRSSDAIEKARKARTLDPLSPVIAVNVGTVYYQGGHLEEAIAEFRRTLETDRSFDRGRFELARALEVRGDIDEAAGIFEDLARNGEAENIAALARIRALQGKHEESRAMVSELIAGERYVNPYAVAAVYVALRDHDSAFEWLDRAYDDRVSRLIYMDVEPMFRSIRADPRFAALRTRMKYPS